MARKFWNGSVVNIMLRKPRKTIRKAFRAVRGGKSNLESLLDRLPSVLSSIEGGAKLLDRNFPIREGGSHVDLIAESSSGGLVFIWGIPTCNAPVLSRLLADYDWIQKNCALWRHLFPESFAGHSSELRIWIFTFEIDSEVRNLLNYLHGVQIGLFLSHFNTIQASWTFTPWRNGERSVSAPLKVLPSLPASPAARPASAGLLTQGELNDLLGVVSGSERWNGEEETTV